MENKNMKQFALQRITYSISGYSIGSYVSKKMQYFENYDLLTMILKSSLNAERVTKTYKFPNDTFLLFTNVLQIMIIIL